MIDDRTDQINNQCPRTCAAENHHARTTAILDLLRAGRRADLVLLADAARRLGVPVRRLLTDWRLSVARVRSGRDWYTTTAEVERLRDVLAAEGNG